jgi:hypothetical protein
VGSNFFVQSEEITKPGTDEGTTNTAKKGETQTRCDYHKFIWWNSLVAFAVGFLFAYWPNAKLSRGDRTATHETPQARKNQEHEQTEQ